MGFFRWYDGFILGGVIFLWLIYLIPIPPTVCDEGDVLSSPFCVSFNDEGDVDKFYKPTATDRTPFFWITLIGSLVFVGVGIYFHSKE